MIAASAAIASSVLPSPEIISDKTEVSGSTIVFEGSVKAVIGDVHIFAAKIEMDTTTKAGERTFICSGPTTVKSDSATITANNATVVTKDGRVLQVNGEGMRVENLK